MKIKKKAGVNEGETGGKEFIKGGKGEQRCGVRGRSCERRLSEGKKRG